LKKKEERSTLALLYNKSDREKREKKNIGEERTELSFSESILVEREGGGGGEKGKRGRKGGPFCGSRPPPNKKPVSRKRRKNRKKKRTSRPRKKV